MASRRLVIPICLLSGAWFLVGLWFPGCSKPPDPWLSVPGGPTKVLVSFPPLYSFTKYIAGDHAKLIA